MSNVVNLPPSPVLPTLDVRPLVKLLDMLFVAAVINDNEYRLGNIIAAAFQKQGDFLTTVTRESAAQTCVLLDGSPLSGKMDSDPRRFSHALMMLQLTAGIFSHHSKPGVLRAKDRFKNFAYDLRSEGDPELIIKQATPVFVQFRIQNYNEIYAEAQRKIEARVSVCRFAHIDTKNIEDLQATL